MLCICAECRNETHQLVQLINENEKTLCALSLVVEGFKSFSEEKNSFKKPSL